MTPWIVHARSVCGVLHELRTRAVETYHLWAYHVQRAATIRGLIAILPTSVLDSLGTLRWPSPATPRTNYALNTSGVEPYFGSPVLQVFGALTAWSRHASSIYRYYPPLRVNRAIWPKSLLSTYYLFQLWAPFATLLSQQSPSADSLQPQTRPLHHTPHLTPKSHQTTDKISSAKLHKTNMNMLIL